MRINLRRRDGHHDSKRDTKKRLNSGGMEVKRITMKTIFARNGKHNTRKQEAEGRESFNRMSGHVFSRWQWLAAARTFMQIVARAGWAFGFMHSVLVGEFASVESTLSLSPSLSRAPLSIFTFYSRHIPANTYICICIYIEPPRNARQYRPICIRDASLQPLSNFPFLSLSPSLSFSPRANQPLSGRAFLSSLALSILFNRVETRKGSTVERDRLFA